METIRFTRNPTTCRLVDDEKPQVILSNTPYELDALLPHDRLLAFAKRKAVVFFGSSSIVWWRSMDTDFPAYSVLNRGFGGSNLVQCYQEFKRTVYPLEPSVLIIYAGENDIADGQVPLNVEASFRQLIFTARRFYPSIPIAFIALKPSPARADRMPLMNDANNRIRNDIQLLFPRVTFINIWPDMLLPSGQPNPDLFVSDQLHMNRKGYDIWTRLVTNYLQSVL